MLDLLTLQQKIEGLPCSISLANDEYGSLRISRKDFQFHFSDMFTFSYTEKRDLYLANSTHKNSYSWLIKYIFCQSDLESAEIVFRNSNKIDILFSNKIALIVTNKISGFKHDSLLVDKISISFLNIEDSLDVFNLFRKLKT